MKPKWMDKKDAHRTKSDKRVKKVAKSLGGRVVSNSGATWYEKGDIVVGDNLLEHKQTEKASFKLDKAVLKKTYRDAVKAGKVPVLMIDFGDYYTIGQIFKGGIK